MKSVGHLYDTHTELKTSAQMPYLPECKTTFIPEIWHLNMCGHLKFMYEAPNQAMPNRIVQNWTMLSQTKACITALSCEICTLVLLCSTEG
jgi:hypothetical protein